MMTAPAKPRRITRQGVVLLYAGGVYTTEDGAYEISWDSNAITECENPHPVTLPREKWRDGYDARGRYRTIKGYQCPGGAEHGLPLWNLWDTAADDHAGDSPYETMRDAVRGLVEVLASCCLVCAKPTRRNGRGELLHVNYMDTANDHVAVLRIQDTEMAKQVRALHAATGRRIVIDADCPACHWPERNFNGDVFGCPKCPHTSERRDS